MCPPTFQESATPATHLTKITDAKSSTWSRQKILPKLKTHATSGRLKLGSERKIPAAEKIKSEDMEQAEFVQYMRQIHPEHRVFAIPNGGHRSKSTAAKLKVTGVTAGVPDLFIPSLHLFIEMKRVKGGRTSAEQLDWLRYLRSIGYHAHVCNGKDEAINAVSYILNNC